MSLGCFRTLAAFAVTLGLATHAFAAPGDGEKKPGGPGGPGREAMIKKFDKNGDGKLDDGEKAAARESFMKMRGGAGAPGGKPGEGKPGEGGPNREAMIKKFDKNGDGKLDDGEKAAAKEAFEKMRAAGGKPGEGKKPGGKKPE